MSLSRPSKTEFELNLSAIFAKMLEETIAQQHKNRYKTQDTDPRILVWSARQSSEVCSDRLTTAPMLCTVDQPGKLEGDRHSVIGDSTALPRVDKDRDE